MILTIIGTTMLPWIQQQKFEKIENDLNLMKLHNNVDCHVLKQNLKLEFPKWLPLPWKHQKFQNASNVLKICRKMNYHANM